MIEKKSWKEFADSKLLWWVNRSLHLFGWAIVIEVDQNNIMDVYPAKVKFRGFDLAAESEGFEVLTRHLHENVDKLLKDCEES